MKSPLVSVIVPNYNHAPYIDIRIQSILNQTFQDFEIIILDDFSTDNSRNVIEKYRTNPKVSSIVYNEKNSGSTFIQWNKGFGLARGKYIWIAESDDFCDKTFLKCLIDGISQNDNSVIAFSKSQKVDSEGKMLYPFLQQQKDKFLRGRAFIFFCMLIGNTIENASSAIFRKDVLEKIHRDYMSYKAAGDRLFWIEIAEKGNVVMVNKPLNYFRQHAIKVSPKRQIDGTVFKEDYTICNYLRENGYINTIMYFFVKNHYISLIHRCSLSSEDLRSELLQLWNASVWNSKTISYLIDGIYRKIIKHVFSFFV